MLLPKVDVHGVWVESLILPGNKPWRGRLVYFDEGYGSWLVLWKRGEGFETAGYAELDELMVLPEQPSPWWPADKLKVAS